MTSERKHRKFYVNGKLEFALFYDLKINNKEQILKSFFESKDWKFMANYCDWKVKSVEVNSDLTEVYIKLKEEKSGGRQ